MGKAMSQEIGRKVSNPGSCPEKVHTHTHTHTHTQFSRKDKQISNQ